MEEEKIYITKGDAVLALLEKGQLLCKTLPVLHAAIFVNYKETRKADELYDEIVKIVGRAV